MEGLDVVGGFICFVHSPIFNFYLSFAFLGGYGTWAFAMAQPSRFAAIIPICGGGDVQRVSVLKDLPIWNFHGKLDDVIPVEASLSLIKILNSPLVKSTVYPNLKHDSWTETYNNPEIFKWLLQQTKNAYQEKVEGTCAKENFS